MSANAGQVGGTHYAGKFQHWDFVMLVLGGRYLEGNLTKYATRWRKKNGSTDVKKALHYLDKIEELFKAGVLSPPNASPVDQSPLLYTFATESKLWYSEEVVCRVASRWKDLDDLKFIRSHLDTLLIEAEKMERSRDEGVREAFEDG